MSSSPIRGKVARILDARNIVINIGSEQGVYIDMYFDVMDPKGEDIKDPDTHTILGSIERPKLRVKTIEVKDKLSVASTYKKIKINLGGSGSTLDYSLAKHLMPPKWVIKYETLKTTEKTWEDLDEQESFVKIGDPVVQVLTEVNENEGDVDNE